MKNLRKISNYIPSVKDKYFITSDGVLYVEQRCDKSVRIIFEGVKTNHSKEIKTFLLNSNESYYTIPLYSGKYVYLRENNILLKRLNTQCSSDTRGRVCVWLYDVLDKHVCYSLHRLLYSCYIGNCEGYDIHHIDFNPLNNTLENLQKLTREDHINLHKKS